MRSVVLLHSSISYKDKCGWLVDKKVLTSGVLPSLCSRCTDRPLVG